MKRNILIIISLIAIDQIIKLIVINTLAISNISITLIPNFLSLNYVENAGAAFGLFGMGSRIFLILLDLLIIFFIIKLVLSKKNELGKNAKFAMSLVLAGGIGNVIDRIIRGYVVDYIDVTKLFKFPVFNFADICIVTGIVIAMIIIIVSTVKTQEAETTK